MAGINKIGGGMYDPGYIAPTQNTEVKTDEASLGNDPKKLKPKAKTDSKGGTKSGTSGAEKQPDTITETSEVVPEKESGHKSWAEMLEDDDLERRIQDYERTGWDNLDYDDQRLYLDLVNESSKRSPADAYKKNRASNQNHANLMHNVLNYKSNYKNTSELAKSRDKTMKDLEGQEGKEKGTYGYLPAFLFGDFGNYKGASTGSTKKYHVLDSRTGESLGTTSQKNLNDWNKNWKTYLKENGLKLSEPDENGHVNLVDSDGRTLDTFNSKEEAESFVKNPYKLGELAEERFWVKDRDGNRRQAVSKEDAREQKKALNEMYAPERKKAWATFLHHMVNSLGTGLLNNARAMSDLEPNVQSSWAKELQKRIDGNNELYYENEKGKSNSVRRLMELNDMGVINLNNLNNENIARMKLLYGEEFVRNLMNTIGKQEFEKLASTDMYKNWTPEQQKYYQQWSAARGTAPVNETLLAIASGEKTFSDVARKWSAQTKNELAKMGIEVRIVEEAVNKAILENKMTQAQADVIKELVGEQLKAAELSNKRQIQQMATESANTLAKILDAAIPG